MEELQGLNVAAVGDQCVTAEEEGGDANDFININLSVQVKMVFWKTWLHSLSKAACLIRF